VAFGLSFTAGLSFMLDFLDQRLARDFDSSVGVNHTYLFAEFKETTGRFNIDWKPDFSFTDDSLLYFSYARGYKAGGVNPPCSASVFASCPAPTFAPEFVDSFEVGSKNTLMGGAMVLTVMFGIPLGVLLYLSGKGRLAANPVLNGLLSLVVNILRSVPFIILLIVMLPVTVLLVGTSLGVAGAIPPLVVGAAPFYARLVETALREVDKGVVEATQAMGGSTFQIVTRALLPEAMPGILAGATVTAIALVSYTAMAGVVGAGGLGDLAIRFGYQRFQTDVMVVTVVLLLLLVQVLQMLGDRLVAAVSHR
jgi:D-methionine transport system permease protein